MSTDELAAEIDREIEAIQLPSPDDVGDDGGASEEEAAVKKVEKESTEESEETGTDETVAEETATDEETSSEEGSKKDEVEEEEDGEKKETPKPIVLDDGILTRAVEAGIPLADAREFSSDASLERMIAAMDRAKDSDPVEIKDEKEVDSETDDLFKDLPKLDPEHYEPEAIEYFNRLTEIVKKQQEALLASDNRHDEASRVALTQATEEVEQWFDKQVEELGDGFSEALGKGKFNSLSRGSSQLENREKIANQMSVLLAGYQATEQSVPPRAEVFDTAVRLVLQKEHQAVYEKKLSDKLRKRSSQHISKGGSNQASGTQTPDDETVALLEKKFDIKP